MKDWRNHLEHKVVVEEYTITIKTQHDDLCYKTHYVKKNGFTYIEPSIVWPIKELSQDGKDFNEWLKIRSDLNTRYDRPHWYRRIRFNRKKKIVIWTLQALDKAYSTFYQEKYDKLRNL